MQGFAVDTWRRRQNTAGWVFGLIAKTNFVQCLENSFEVHSGRLNLLSVLNFVLLIAFLLRPFKTLSHESYYVPWSALTRVPDGISSLQRFSINYIGAVKLCPERCFLTNCAARRQNKIPIRDLLLSPTRTTCTMARTKAQERFVQ